MKAVAAMVRADTITLIADTPEAHGIYDEFAETQSAVFAEVLSVGMKEMYMATSQGLKPEIKFRLTLAEDYHGESRLTYNGAMYRVLRTYMDGDGIELTCGRWSDDV